MRERAERAETARRLAVAEAALEMGQRREALQVCAQRSEGSRFRPRDETRPDPEPNRFARAPRDSRGEKVSRAPFPADAADAGPVPHGFANRSI